MKDAGKLVVVQFPGVFVCLLFIFGWMCYATVQEGRDGDVETLTLLLFCAALVVCVALNWSILYALGAGMVLFLCYGRKRGYGWKELGKMCLDGVKTARNILITFFLIGVLTALWRASGTIPAIISYTVPFIRPSLFLVMTFLLNCLVSVLTGTSFGTAATMGVICATLGAAMEVPTALVGGAVLSGVFFGDRCSPVSTSALLVSELTQTNIFDNIRGMIRTAWVPFLAASLLYLVVGMATPHTQTSLDLAALFETEFRLHWAALLPALVIFVLALCQVPVKRAMLASIVSAVPICLVLQHLQPGELLRFALMGYQAREEAVGAMLNGGGVVSMVRVAVIVCISSAYSGIFQKTGLLDRLQQAILTLSRRITPFGAMLCTSVLASAMACNQTLAIILTHQLCKDAQPSREETAISLENSVVVVAPLIPWSIAGGVPLASVGAPMVSICFAFFLYLLPLWRLGAGKVRCKRK